MKSISNQKTIDILNRLNSAGAGSAWPEFIDLFAPVIMKSATQFDYQQGRSSECFLYVCGKLSEDGFQRLLKFKPGGKARFSTWLGAVVFNLCVDWHRKEFGRAQLLPAISGLPAFDQAVYRLCFEQCLSGETVFQTLRADFPDLTRQQLADAKARVHSLLTPRQRWRISVQLHRRRCVEKSRYASPDLVPDTKSQPELDLQSDQQSMALKNAVSRLPGEQRLILALRFEQGLTLKKIGEVMHLGDPYRAKRHLQAALDAVSFELKADLVQKEAVFSQN